MLRVAIIVGSTRPWRRGEAVARFVTPAYNHATSGALKNAIDYLYSEWNNKAAGFVGYGGAGGSRALALHRLRELQRLQAGTTSGEVGSRLAGSGDRVGRGAEIAARA
jgi:NAD(P)H-dependent FMN reductase